MKPVSILIGGDIAPTSSNYNIFEAGNIEALIDQELLSLIRAADYRIFNLELPLTDVRKPIIKDGPNLIAPVATFNGIRLLNPTIFGLSNNHIMDHDDQGLFQTMEILKKNNVDYVGAGEDLEKAAKPRIIEADGKKIGIYACAENEFSIAGMNKPGANPFDPLDSPDHIQELKSRCDFVIVLYHGGKEHYRYPSPYLRKVCRKMVDKGADLIVCQHSHCIGAFEQYSGGVIVYGQGNFLFDRNYNELWKTSLLVNATFGEKMTVDFVPFGKDGIGIALAGPELKTQILEAFNERSRNILMPGFVEKEYEIFCREKGLSYMGVFAGLGRVLRKADRMTNGLITNRLYSLKKLNMIQNFIECEAHRELVVTYLNLRRRRNHK
jgi:poly-gamma-glutamate synthesis protein (capsule biosynthesis protein)